jgi:hypothetical protein
MSRVTITGRPAGWLGALRSSIGRGLSALGFRRPAKRLIAACADRLGIPHTFGGEDIADDIRAFIRRSKPLPTVEDDSAHRVLFFTPRGVGDHIPYFTGLLSNALRIRGAEVGVVVCDGGLPACETCAITDYADVGEFLAEGPARKCGRCRGRSTEILDAFGAPYMSLSDFTTDEDRQEAREFAADCSEMSLSEIMKVQWRGMQLGEHVRTSMYRFYLAGTFEDDDLARDVALRFVEAGVIAARAAGSAIRHLGATRLVSHHGIYLLGGVACEVGRSMSIPVVAWDAAYRLQSVVFSHGDTYHHDLRTESTGAWESSELTTDQRRDLREYLDSRRVGNLDRLTYHPRPEEDRTVIAEEIGLQPGESLAVAFTNVTWDGRVHVPEALYPGPREWVLDTIGQLAGAEKVRLVIRVHPAEVKNEEWKAQERLADVIGECFPSLPHNVVVVPPESDMSSYALIDMSDVALVYSSKIGLEAAVSGVPVVITGDALYSKKGIGLEPASPEEYRDLLHARGWTSVNQAMLDERAERYAYYFFFRRILQLPAVWIDHDGRYPCARDLTELVEGTFPGLDAICHGLMEGDDFLVAG